MKFITLSPYLKSFIYLSLLSILFGCKEKSKVKPIDDCASVEVNISCDRPATQAIQNIYTLLASHDPNGLHILNTYLDGCFENEDKIQTINSYVSGGARFDTIFGLSVVTHELAHALAGRYTSASASYCEIKLAQKIWIDAQTEINVKKKDLFPAKEIYNSLIPVAANSFYADQYIKEERHASQVLGAYALLDEFNAYSQGLSTVLKMHSAYDELFQASRDTSILDNFVLQFENEVASYYMFKYFVLLYVDYAKDNHPEDYKDLKNNAGFWRAFDAVDTKFKTLLIDYKALVSSDVLLSAVSDFDNLYNNSFRLLEDEIKKLE